MQNNYQYGTKPKAILVICTTGKGTALKLERMLLDLVQQLTDEIIEIISISALKMSQEIEKLKLKYQIIASVGTKNPQLQAPFIELSSLVDGKGENVIRQSLSGKKKATLKNTTPMVVKDLCKDTFSMYLVYLNLVHIADLLLEWMKELQIQLNQHFSNTRLIRVIIHTGFAFERVIKKNNLSYDDPIEEKVAIVAEIVAKTIQKVESKLDLFLSKDEKLYIAEAIIQE
ncbi:MAG TPA: PRD domain-containing protein [Enterococcus columbae]|nr:PRD domain-containing protein [Enterococcus columbae]